MDLGQCLENLKYDIGNGGVEDDTFATNCYITMAKKARRRLDEDASDEQAREYLETCAVSECNGLMVVATS